MSRSGPLFTMDAVNAASPLYRDADHRVVGGVCAGIARRLGVDPTLGRATAIVLIAVTNGLALLAYLALWVALPVEGRSDRRRPGAWGALVLAGVGLLVLAYALPSSRISAVISLVLAGIVVAGSALIQSPRPGAVTSTAPRGELGHGASAWGHPTNRAPLRRLILTTLAATAALWTVTGTIALVGVPVAPIVWPAIALGVTGLALVRAGLQPCPHGRPRGLIVAGFVIALITLALMLPHRDPGLSHRAETLFAGGAASEQQLSAGTHTIDLADLPADPERPLTFTQQAGSLRFVVPHDRGVRIEASARIGQVVVPGREPLDGLDRTVIFEQAAREGEASMLVKATIDVGQIEVVR